MFPEKYYERLRALFRDLDFLEASPASGTAAIREQLCALRGRLEQLESEFRNGKASLVGRERPAAAQAESQILYEKEKVGYAYAGDRLEALGAEDLGEVKKTGTVQIPLAAGGETIGEVQIEPPERALTEDELGLAADVARKASQQIQNLRLLAAMERARAEAETASHRFVHEGWASYLDAIHQNERIGYMYDQTAVTPYVERLHPNSGHLQPVEVTSEQVGAIYLKTSPSRPLEDDDRELIAAVARRVGQQVENLRLLADASRARAEAEEATRQLTRENWRTYTTQAHPEARAFAYDSVQVAPLKAADLPKDVVLLQPLVVRGETVGQLAVAGLRNVTTDGSRLAASIAAQASTHIETLRLAEQNQKRAYEMEAVAELSTTTSTELDPDRLIQTIVDLTKQRFGIYHAQIYLADESWRTLLLAAGAGDVGRQMVADEHAISLDAEQSLVARSARERRASIVNDARSDPGFLPNPLLPDTRAEMAVPMVVGDRLLGVFDVQSDQVSGFGEEDAGIYTTLASQVAIALQNARLYAEQAATVTQLRELDRLKSSFLANMSHELRTPLNSILGFADVMLAELDGPLGENMNTDLQLIQKNGQHLLHLINDVLDMAKIEAGRMNLVPEQFVVQDVLEEVVSITSTLASERHLSLYVDQASDAEVSVLADRTRLRQVMINLVNNAIKFTDEGRISIRAQRQGENAVLIAVSDTGIGILPEKLETIFQEFAQIDTSTTRKAGGTGLGLPISRSLVEMHGGRLWAESTGIAGEGSTFYVELPLEAQMAEPAERTER
jgi:signal transduction histidine kinase